MKKIVTSQMPVAKIARPLLLGSLLISTAGVSADDDPSGQSWRDGVHSFQSIISGSKGSVAGAKQWEPVFNPPSTSSKSSKSSSSYYGCVHGGRGSSSSGSGCTQGSRSGK
jgi:hypothetical protein